MNPNPDFSSWLRQARTTHDLTQEALAEAVGCATQTIRAFESGRRRPSREMAARIAEILQIAPSDRSLFVQLARAPQPPDQPAPAPTETATPAGLAPRPSPQRPSFFLPSDPLIGRQSDLERVRQAILSDQQRLVTILGPGGIGKTRLAMQIAADLSACYADGAAFVGLAPVIDVANVVTAIAEAIGHELPSTQQPDEALLTFLRERTMLLVLDNLEQLLGPPQGDRLGTLLTALVQDAPQLSILVTSRERLRLRDEIVIELDGLALPSDNRAAIIRRSDAVQLFLERARHVAQGFILGADNRDAVAQICGLLGGIPLAIELAATWVRALSCDEIAAEIAQNIDFLTHSNRNILPRHRSLRAVIDHSWELLTDIEQQVIAHLSVFYGGCHREAVLAVLPESAPGNTRASQRNMLAVLAALVDKSLLRRITDEAGVTRYDLHELVRQYAAERLDDQPEAASITQARHAAYYAAWVADQGPILKSGRQKVAQQAITTEIDNIRAAWRWGCEQRDSRLLRQMTLTLHWFFEVRGWHTEAFALFSQASAAIRPLAERPDATAPLLADYWLLVSMDGWHALRHDPVYALTYLQAAMDGQRAAGDMQVCVNCAFNLGYLKIFLNDYNGAQLLLEEARDGAVATGDQWSLSVALVVRGILEVLRSDAVTARRHLSDALLAARTTGDPRHISLALNYFGLTALHLGHFDEAEQACRECMAIAVGNQDRYQMSLVLQSLGRVALSRGDYAESRWMFHEGLAIARGIGDRWLEAQALGCLGILARTSGDHLRAREFHRAAVAAAAAAPPPIALDELAALAHLEQATQPEAALTAFTYIERHPLTRPGTQASVQDWLEQIRPTLLAEQLQMAESRSPAFGLEQPSSLLSLFLS